MSSERKSTVWIDLTDLMAWKGHFSGIQRVVFTIAQQYYHEGAHFFVYSKSKKRSKFIEVSGEGYFTERIESSTRKRDKVKQVYRVVVPSAVRRISSPLIRRNLHYIFLFVKYLKGELRTNDPLFKEGDVILLLGAPWESEGLIRELSTRKSVTNFKVVHFLHDILPISQPQLFDQKLVERFEDYMKIALPLCDGLLSASQATLNDVKSFAAKAAIALPARQSTVREGEDTYVSVRPKRPLVLKGATSDFIFCLGTLEVRKNHQLLYQVYKLAQMEGIDLPMLVIVGKPGWLARDFFDVLTRDVSLDKKIIVIEGASDAEVLWLYDHCLFTVYPSLCEGWGLSIADALGKGKLCLTSNVSSMPEVAGELGDYFSPYDSHECMEKIEHYYANREALHKKELEIQGYTPHTWRQTFMAVQDFIDEL